jgi:hypothetical protein
MAKDATAVAADALSASRGASSITKGNRPLHVVEGLRKANCHPLRFFFDFFLVGLRRGRRLRVWKFRLVLFSDG